MKRKISLTVVAVLLLAAISIPAAFAAQGNVETPSNAAPKMKQEINLTDAQKKELKQLSGEMFELKKKMIQKYMEFGIITKEQGELRLKKLDEMKKKMEENGFTPGYGKGFGGHGKDRKGKHPKTDGQQPQ